MGGRLAAIDYSSKKVTFYSIVVCIYENNPKQFRNKMQTLLKQ